MSEAFETTVAPDMPQVRDWLARLRLQQGLDAARQALHMLRLRHPGHAGVQELLDWHDAQWWQPLEFGGIRLERRAPEHFEFVWSVVLNRDFSAKLKHIPEHLTARDLLHILTQDHTALLPDSRSGGGELGRRLAAKLDDHAAQLAAESERDALRVVRRRPWLVP